MKKEGLEVEKTGVNNYNFATKKGVVFYVVFTLICVFAGEVVDAKWGAVLAFVWLVIGIKFIFDWIKRLWLAMKK